MAVKFKIYSAYSLKYIYKIIILNKNARNRFYLFLNVKNSHSSDFNVPLYKEPERSKPCFI